MILILGNQVLNVDGKAKFTTQLVQQELGSDFYDTDATPWLGDLLGTEALLPQWLLQAYQNDPSNVTLIPFIKYYFRWLFSQEYGYGAQLNWENIRVPLYMNSIFLEALGNFYFPGMDFSTTPYKEILPNIRKFSTKVDANYFNIKGTENAIKYAITALLGFSWDDVFVLNTSPSNVQIQIRATKLQNLKEYDTFLAQYVIPAGVIVEYKEFS